MKVKFKEPENYLARFVLSGGEELVFTVDKPQIMAPYEGRYDIQTIDGRTISFNWSRVAFVEFSPRGEKLIVHEIPDDRARELLASGRAVPI